MLTAEDIKNIIEAQKEIFVTKEDLVDFEIKINEKFDRIATTLDLMVKQMREYHEEMIAMRLRLERMEYKN